MKVTSHLQPLPLSFFPVLIYGEDVGSVTGNVGGNVFYGKGCGELETPVEQFDVGSIPTIPMLEIFVQNLKYMIQDVMCKEHFV